MLNNIDFNIDQVNLNYHVCSALNDFNQTLKYINIYCSSDPITNLEKNKNTWTDWTETFRPEDSVKFI